MGYAESASNDDIGPSSEVLFYYDWPRYGSAPALVSDLRLPPDFTVHKRVDEKFAGFDSFKGAVANQRARMNTPMACFESYGWRYAGLQRKHSALGTEQAESWDLFDLGSGTRAGHAFVYRVSSSATCQHWVLFERRVFDELHCARRSSGGFTSLQDFLSGMAAIEEERGPVAHSIENCTHYIDCPW